jgi:uncharacterized protein YqgQ
MAKFLKIFLISLFFFTELFADNISVQLDKLSDLYNQGILTKEEFDKAKKIILKIQDNQKKKIEKIPEIKAKYQDYEKKNIKYRRWFPSGFETGNKKGFEHMEMVVGDFRLYTHRPGGIKITRRSDRKQLAVIGDNLKVKFYNQGKFFFDVETDKDNLELKLKLNDIPILVWKGKYVKTHRAHFYQVLAMGSKPFHYYIKLDTAKNAAAINMEKFDSKIKAAVDKVKIKLAREYNVSIEQIDDIMLRREYNASKELDKAIGEETDKILKEAVDKEVNEAIEEALSKELEAAIGEALAAEFINAIEVATGQAIDAALEQELASAIDEAIAEAINAGISEAAITAGIAAYLEALASGASEADAINAGNAACDARGGC